MGGSAPNTPPAVTIGVYYVGFTMCKHNGPRYLALALLAMRNGMKDKCMQYMSKAAEFGDDLTQFVDQVQRIGNTATRNRPQTSETENSISPSLHVATASSEQQRFLAAASTLSKQIALSRYLDEGDELVEDESDPEQAAFAALDFDSEGFDDDDVIGPVRLV